MLAIKILGLCFLRLPKISFDLLLILPHLRHLGGCQYYIYNSGYSYYYLPPLIRVRLESYLGILDVRLARLLTELSSWRSAPYYYRRM